MKNVNKVTLMGTLTCDPTEKNHENGSKSIMFSMKTKKFVGKGENKKSLTYYHQIIMWQNVCGVAMDILHKDDIIYLEGEIKSSKSELEGFDIGTEIVVNEWTKINDNNSTEE